MHHKSNKGSNNYRNLYKIRKPHTCASLPIVAVHHLRDEIKARLGKLGDIFLERDTGRFAEQSEAKTLGRMRGA